VRKADNLPPSCTVVTKSGNLNFVEPSEPLRACNGTAAAMTACLNETDCRVQIDKYLCDMFPLRIV